MGLKGFEPLTLRLSSACSNQLSYRPTAECKSGESLRLVNQELKSASYEAPDLERSDFLRAWAVEGGLEMDSGSTDFQLRHCARGQIIRA